MDQVAIVTGASRGIGASIARRLAQTGASVALLSRGAAALGQVESEIRAAGGTCVPVVCDVSQRGSVEDAVTAVEARLGPVTILINNAGLGGPFHLLHEVSDEEWDALFATNLKSIFWFARRLLPRMKEQGYGRIVNISSIHGLFGASRSSTYIATKHAMIGYTKAIAAEWGKFGINCNAICPGYVNTSMGIQPAEVAGQEARVLDRIPLHRQATPSEIAGMVAFLVGPEGAYVNGASLVIDGGLTADLAVS